MSQSPPLTWRKSSRSAQGADCVEVAEISGQRAIRDSKIPGGATLPVTPHTWSSLLARIKQGHHDLH
ncbi:DUF397 domain-containing protein [Actinomadura sp. WMMB 499]|uniref:DUF397 domain-containing protein n=1 Tax=Actinomadura sp. WMMB 499 TaxID=1219491 RepID=UPI001247F274|nr:DUF397 domain-containing protein [Actinomadura sp. WMMB 499]QFG20987.1 DUF397 domain-containing protein [Actinomadura sp. WMMB 499]